MKKLTGIFIIAITVIIIVFDLYVLFKGGVSTTISAVLLEKSKSLPIIPFALGVVCGHLFWPNKGQ